MMSVHQRRIKQVVFTIGGTAFECQLKSYKIMAGQEDGDQQYTLCPDGAFIEETDSKPTLELTFFSDWRSGGISDYLWQNAGETAAFVLDKHPNVVGEHVRFSGQVVLRAPDSGGESRETEMTEVTLQIVGTLNEGLTYERIG